MLKPAYKIQVGSETFETGIKSPVVNIRVNLSMDIPAGSCEIILAQGDRSSKIKEGDDISIQIGYEGSLVDVFKGSVDSVEPRISDIRVTGMNFASKLLELRTDRLYEDQSAGKIASDLSQTAGLSTEEVSNGLSFKMYVVDHSKNAYYHIRDLAERCGFDVYVTGENKLVFKKYERSEPINLEYGKDIIQAELQEEKPIIARVVVQGESPSSFKGADTSHWLTKREVQGEAGSGASLLIQDPTLRDKDTAEKVAKAKLDALSRLISGTVEIVGKADVKLGDTVKLQSMKDSRMNGEFQVRTVEHYLSKNAGFVTLIGWRK